MVFVHLTVHLDLSLAPFLGYVICQARAAAWICPLRPLGLDFPVPLGLCDYGCLIVCILLSLWLGVRPSFSRSCRHIKFLLQACCSCFIQLTPFFFILFILPLADKSSFDFPEQVKGILCENKGRIVPESQEAYRQFLQNHID